MLSIKEFFDFQKYPFEHEKLFQREGISNVVDVLNHIGPYCREWLSEIKKSKNHPALRAPLLNTPRRAAPPLPDASTGTFCSRGDLEGTAEEIHLVVMNLKLSL